MDITVITLDASILQTREEIHNFLQKAFDFPEYYGRNLDALYDCLTQPLNRTYLISVLNASAATDYFVETCEVFADVAQEKEEIIYDESMLDFLDTEEDA